MDSGAGLGLIAKKAPLYQAKDRQETSFIGKGVSPYSTMLNSYLKQQGTMPNSYLKQQGTLSYLCLEKILSERSLHPLLVEELECNQYPQCILEKTLDLVFSPKLTKHDWKEQLQALKAHNATICGLELKNFDSVDVVDLSKIQPDQVDVLIGRNPQELIVVHGKCMRNIHLPISKGTTVIGSEVMIFLEGNELKLPIEKAVIVANKKEILNKRDEWVIQKSRTEVNTDARKFKCGYFPVVYLDRSSIMGVEIDAADCCQGIVGSHGEIQVSNNKVLNTRECGIFLHDCDSVTATGNELKTKRPHDKIGIVSSSCKKVKLTVNITEYA